MASKASKNGGNAGRRLSSARLSGTKGTSAGEKELSAYERKAERRKRVNQVAIGVFAVLMALSMMLPSLSVIFGGTTGQTAQGSGTSVTTATQATSIEEVDANYSSLVSSLESTLASNPKDQATLLSLGQTYMDWGYEASGFATDDAGTSHANGLFAKAVGYFDDYLALGDSDAVSVSRAMCLFYSGDNSGAAAALEQITADSPDFAPAWTNLGIVYETTGKTDAAKAAYQKAIEADADDTYGAKSFSQGRLDALAAAETAAATDADGATSDAGAAASGELGDTLADKSGTNL